MDYKTITISQHCDFDKFGKVEIIHFPDGSSIPLWDGLNEYEAYRKLGTPEQLTADLAELAEFRKERDEAIGMLEELEKCRGDRAETYTTGYDNGWHNGRAQLIRNIFKIYDSRVATKSEAEASLNK